jgi:FKBP-type peptidyl-prolyl cis-trans isomerase
MKRVVLGLAMLALISLASCDSGYTEMESGYAYKFVENPNGKKAELGDIMLIRLKSIYGGDSLLVERKSDDDFFINPFEPSLGGFKEVLDLCDEGDSIHIKMPLKMYSSLTRMPIQAGMDTSKFVVMQMRITEIENESVVIARVKAEQQKKDRELIQAYIAEKGLEAVESPDGIFQVVLEEGTGPRPEVGQQASVDYTLRLPDGTLIDTSHEAVAREGGTFDERRMPYRPYTFTVGSNSVIGGWNKGIPLVRKGGKSILLIPSHLGFGTNVRPGSEIPPNAVLVFEVEVVDIK